MIMSCKAWLYLKFQNQLRVILTLNFDSTSWIEFTFKRYYSINLNSSLASYDMTHNDSINNEPIILRPTNNDSVNRVDSGSKSEVDPGSINWVDSTKKVHSESVNRADLMNR